MNMPADFIIPTLDHLREVLRDLLRQPCLHCHLGRPDLPICRTCEALFPQLGVVCPCCAQPLGSEAPVPRSLAAGDLHPTVHAQLTLVEPCVSCLRQLPAFDRSYALYRYAHPIDRLVRDLKFNARLPLASFFAGVLNRDIAAHRFAVARAGFAAPDLILPVPLPAARLRRRGFNQSHEIARRLRRPSNVDYRPRWLQRRRDAPAQSGLGAAARRANLRGAFAVNGDVRGRRGANVADVMTTGATLDEIARTLKDAGARTVENWIIARAVAFHPAQRHAEDASHV